MNSIAQALKTAQDEVLHINPISQPVPDVDLVAAYRVVADACAYLFSSCCAVLLQKTGAKVDLAANLGGTGFAGGFYACTRLRRQFNCAKPMRRNCKFYKLLFLLWFYVALIGLNALQVPFSYILKTPNLRTMLR